MAPAAICLSTRRELLYMLGLLGLEPAGTVTAAPITTVVPRSFSEPLVDKAGSSRPPTMRPRLVSPMILARASEWKWELFPAASS